MDRRRILVIDDNEGLNEVLVHLLSNDYSVETATCGEYGLEKARLVKPHLALVDLMLPDITGLDVLHQLKEMSDSPEVIVMTAYADIESAVEAMKSGAADFLTKPFDNAKLRQQIAKFFSLRERLARPYASRNRIVGQSPQIERVWELVEKFAPSEVTILLQGESGTGKELFARAIHEMSKRVDGPFVPLDCATLPETLVESELFGHEKGAFTGATDRRLGRIELADGGTLFLDEVGNLPLCTQAKFLRLIQECEIFPLGSKKRRSVNFRLVAATNIKLHEAMRRGNFREDLYYRLSTVVIELPPLRERTGDVELLTRHFTNVYATKFGKPITRVSDAAMKRLSGYHWPGNVRELENVIKRAVVLAGEEVLSHHLPGYLFHPCDRARMGNGSGMTFSLELDVRPTDGLDLKRFVAEVAEAAEKQIIFKTLEQTRSNKGRLAKILNVDPKTLREKLRKFGLNE